LKLVELNLKLLKERTVKMRLYDKVIGSLKNYILSDNEVDLRKYSKSIENTFESFLEEFPEFRLEIGKRGVILKNYGVANA
jgi:hypothetical protein